eukprot:4285485-Amphidinium_carterae.1
MEDVEPGKARALQIQSFLDVCGWLQMPHVADFRRAALQQLQAGAGLDVQPESMAAAGHMPIRTPVATAVHTPVEAPVHTPIRTPVAAAVHTPVEAQLHTPVGPLHTPIAPNDLEPNASTPLPKKRCLGNEETNQDMEEEQVAVLAPTEIEAARERE